MSTQRGALRGPQAGEAQAIVDCALSMSRTEAIVLSRAYEADPNPHYLAQCSIIQDALEMTGRSLTIGWFEAVFRHQDWTLDTKALHAIADAVMATLVADVVPADVVVPLTRPWVMNSLAEATY